MYPEFYKCNSRESTFVEFCVDGINLFVENNFIDLLGLGRDSSPEVVYHYDIDLPKLPLKLYNVKKKKIYTAIFF